MIMKLRDYLDGMRQATTATELDAAIGAPYRHRFSGSTWSRICKVRIEAGRRICDAHPDGRFVPRFGPGRNLTVCDESYRVGRGQNSTGVRYAWHFAEAWARDVLLQNGLSHRAAHGVWGCAFDYPHRALVIVGKARAGKLPDPRFNRLIYTGRCVTGQPVRVNRRSGEASGRAHRPCKCGGVLWDWGCGWSGYAYYVNWRCDRCNRTFGMYLNDEGLQRLRCGNPATVAAAVTTPPSARRQPARSTAS